jgi:hypothetical protein
MKHGSDARMDGLGSRAGEGAGDRSCWLSRLRLHSYAHLYLVVKPCEIIKTPAETTLGYILIFAASAATLAVATMLH